MQETWINLEETIGKTVGRRRRPADPLKSALAWQNTVVDLHKAFGNKMFPKGVYRFRSHEEADEWAWKMLTRKK